MYKRQEVPQRQGRGHHAQLVLGRTFASRFEPSSGYSIQKALLNMFWEYSPSSANIASDWLRAKSSHVDEEEIKIKMDDGVARFFTRFGGNFLIC